MCPVEAPDDHEGSTGRDELGSGAGDAGDDGAENASGEGMRSGSVPRERRRIRYAPPERSTEQNRPCPFDRAVRGLLPQDDDGAND